MWSNSGRGGGSRRKGRAAAEAALLVRAHTELVLRARGRTTGTCRWFDAQKVFGFITPHDERVADIFVYQPRILNMGFRRLFEEDEVEFAIGQR